MEKKTYIAPETVEDVVASERFCTLDFQKASGNTEFKNEDDLAGKERKTFENDEKDWGEVEKNIW